MWNKWHLGHNPEDAAQHWNRIGHTRTKAKNRSWNQDPANYWGVEEKYASSATGGSSDRYNAPNPEESHAMWWDPNHPDYIG